MPIDTELSEEQLRAARLIAMGILPIGIVLNETEKATESSTEKQKEMDAKEYNAKIDQRIADIKKTCNIQ